MKRNLSKILAIFMTLALVMSFAAVSASAVTYTAAEGDDDFSFPKNLVVDSTAQIPNVEFAFTIAAGTAVPGGENNALAILAGPTTATAPTIESAQFTSGMTTTAGTPTDDTDTTKKYATDDVVVDFTGITFTAPGVYRYVVTEQASNLPGVTDDTNAVRYLDVFVFPSDEDPTVLEISNIALRNAATNFERVLDEETQQYKYQYTTDADVKTSSYTNTLETVDLEFAKAIDGNQADKNKKFTYTLAIEDANPGDYTVEIVGNNVVDTNSNVDVDEENGTYTITVGSDGTCTAYFYLTDGESVKVKDLNKGYTYTVTEDAEDYQSAVGLSGYSDPYHAENVQVDSKTGYTNTREGAIPTGVIITIAPFVIGLLVFGAVILFMFNRRRRAAY